MFMLTMSHREFGKRLQQSLGLIARPVAIAFRDEAPEGVPRVSAAAPAGCAYWRRAAEGEVFHTTAEDHLNCPIGAYTHGVPLTESKAAELNDTLGFMAGLDYIRTQEVPEIPTLPGPFHYGLYAPLDAAPFAPDVVVVRGNARQIMVLAEAAGAAGVCSSNPAMGRPACAMIPATLHAKEGVTSLGCIGNRVYTGLGDDELYFTIGSDDLSAIAEKVERLVRANRDLEQYHRARLTA
jgi:uncharacterized protein (DUF169 family)